MTRITLIAALRSARSTTHTAARCSASKRCASAKSWATATGTPARASRSRTPERSRASGCTNRMEAACDITLALDDLELTVAVGVGFGAKQLAVGTVGEPSIGESLPLEIELEPDHDVRRVELPLVNAVVAVGVFLRPGDDAGDVELLASDPAVVVAGLFDAFEHHPAIGR